MAGLLGDSWDDPRTMATLQMAAGLLGGGNFGQALGRGLSGYSDSMSASQKDAFVKEQMQWKRQEMEQEKADRAEQARRSNLLRGMFAPITGAQTIGVDGRGPTADKVPLIGQMPQINYQQLIAEGFDPAQVKALADAQNYGRDEVSRVVEEMGPNGEKVQVQYDKFGRKVSSSNGYIAPVQVNQGDKITFTTPQAGASFKVGMSPSERDASARGWAGVQNARDRLEMDRGQGQYSFNAELGGYVPKAPGGKFIPLDGQIKSPKLTDAEAKNTLYLGQMREASAVLDNLNTGPVGVAMTSSPFTNWMAGDDSQKAGQAQRQWAEAYLRAKTGAAATAGEVENNVRTFFPVFGDGEAAIKRKAEARKAAEAGMEMPAGRGAASLPKVPNNNSPKVPMQGQVVDGFKFKGGNPADQANWEPAR